MWWSKQNVDAQTLLIRTRILTVVLQDQRQVLYQLSYTASAFFCLHFRFLVKLLSALLIA